MAPDPEFIDPLLLAEQEKKLAGHLEMSSMQHLNDILIDRDRAVQYQLQFSKDDQGIIYIEGEYSVILNLICQRCLNPFDKPLQNKINIGLVRDKQQAEELSVQYEPLILTSEQITLHELIEDEILLGIDIAPLHEIDECPTRELIKQTLTQKQRPFEVLKEFKVKKD